MEPTVCGGGWGGSCPQKYHYWNGVGENALGVCISCDMSYTCCNWCCGEAGRSLQGVCWCMHWGRFPVLFIMVPLQREALKEGTGFLDGGNAMHASRKVTSMIENERLEAVIHCLWEVSVNSFPRDTYDWNGEGEYTLATCVWHGFVIFAKIDVVDEQRRLAVDTGRHWEASSMRVLWSKNWMFTQRNCYLSNKK